MENKENTFKNIDEYIMSFPEDVRKKLDEICDLIKLLVPEAEETISYQMPTFKYKGRLVYFAAFKNHIGFYPTGNAIAVFQKELAGYKSGKGTIQFPLDKPLPLDLIRKIVEFRAEENNKKANEKKEDDN